MAIPEVMTMLNKIKMIHEKKNEDYSSPDRQYQNFDRAAELISWFDNDRDKAYISLIATKLARLGILLSSGRTPNNESIEDSFIDLCTYCILWASHHEYLKIDVSPSKQ